MKVVVVGSGGREHAICDTLAREGHHVVATPGNPGIAQVGEVSDLAPEALEGDLFVIGPEVPLVDGLADRLRSQGKVVFGPGRDGAMLEGSKEFMKRIAYQAGLPTARYGVFDEVHAAFEYLDSQVPPYVVKTDGLAAGKGVLVTDSLEKARADVVAKLSGSSFGDAGRRVIIEEGMVGLEVSLLVVVDGKRGVPLNPARDHKRLLEGDLGPNTGGMGAYTPVDFFGPREIAVAMDRVVNPAIATMVELGIDYRGLLYAGLMITESGPRLIEFNVRFGDPEAQVVVPLLLGGFGELLLGAASGEVPDPSAPANGAAATVVMAAPGYPEAVRVGGKISGVEDLAGTQDVKVFHAGTRRGPRGELLVAGGRVLSVTGFGPDVASALAKAYAATDCITFEGAQFRRDIGMIGHAENWNDDDHRRS